MATIPCCRFKQKGHPLSTSPSSPSFAVPLLPLETYPTSLRINNQESRLEPRSFSPSKYSGDSQSLEGMSFGFLNPNPKGPGYKNKGTRNPLRIRIIIGLRKKEGISVVLGNGDWCQQNLLPTLQYSLVSVLSNPQCCKAHFKNLLIMAALSHFPPLHSSLSSNKLLSVALPIFDYKLHAYSRHNLPRICASLTKKSRANRKVKSDEELCKDIKEFLSMVGLPQDHVPSTIELSQHGRQELANIVRRRGYKFIRELLTTQIYQQDEKVKDLADDSSLSRESTEIERQTTGLVDDISISGEVEAMKDEEYVNDLVDDISFPSNATEVDMQTENLAEVVSLSNEATEDKDSINNFPDDILLSSEVTEVERQTEHFSEKVSLCYEATKDAEVKINLGEEGVSLSCEHTMSTDNGLEISIELKPINCSYTSLYSSSGASLEEKVAKFVQEGELDDIEENEFEDLSRSPSADSTEATKLQGAIESNSNSIHGAYEDLALSGVDGSGLSNGYLTLSNQQVEHPARETNASRSEILSDDKVMVVNHNEEIDFEAQKADIRVEISRLTYMLHQKELELMKMQEQIENEKLALSVLQNKAEKEISEAQKLISEKDAELRAAEETLSGLKEVEIQYWGEGEIIEIAGSFNGWQQRIRMDPLPSSSILDPTGSRKSRLWRIVLWLYPGVYEIKFIADGHWTVDPQRESVTSGSLHNNILRVDR